MKAQNNLQTPLQNGSKNPLLQFIDSYKAGERMLIEVFSQGVKQYHRDMPQDADLLWLAFDVHSIVKARHYDIVWQWLDELMDRKLIGIRGARGSRKNYRGHIIGEARMGEGDALLIVCISRSQIPHFLEIAELPHIPYTLKMRSKFDRPLYDFFNYLVANKPVPETVEIAGVNITIRESEKRLGWKNVDKDEFMRMQGVEGMDYGRYNCKILHPRLKFLSDPENTDLEIQVEPVSAPGSKRIISLDILTRKRQFLGKIQCPIIDIMLSMVFQIKGDTNESYPPYLLLCLHLFHLHLYRF